MSKKSIFPRAELLCGLFPNMPVRIYMTAENGTMLSAPITEFINRGGSTLVLSNRKSVPKDNPDYNRSFTSGELSRGLLQMHESIGDNAADRVDVRLVIYNIIDGKQVQVIDKELEMLEVDTIRRVIMLTDGSDVIL